MRTRDMYMLGGVGIVVVVLAFWMLLLSPKQKDLASVNKKVDEKQATVDEARTQVSDVKQAKVNFPATYATLAKLGKAAPQADSIDDNVPSLLLEINHGADTTRTRFGDFGVTEDAAGAAAAPATPPASTTPPAGGDATSQPDAAATGAATSTAALTPVAYDVSFEGSFYELEDMIHYLTHMVQVENKRMRITGRLIAINSVSFTPDPEAGGISAKMKMSSYTVPAGEGLTGTTPPVPGADGTTEAASTTPTTPAQPTTPPAVVVKRP